MIDDVRQQSAERMAKAVTHTASEFASVRTGRAAPALVERLKVDYYGAEVALVQLAGFSVPEARVLVITPYDKGAIKAIEKALMHSDLGITPSNDGVVIRLVFPQLTAERRRDLVKMVKNKAEDGRVAVRGVRRSARQDLEGLERSGEISSDDLEWAEKDLDKVTHDHIAEIDRMLARKEQELLEV
ncbi:MAG: ribosome recycling factor [Pseudonocardiaceae bacterium]